MRQSIHDGWTPQPEDEEASYLRNEDACVNVLFGRAEAAEAEVARLSAELASANAETVAAQNETVWLRDAMDGACALRDAERAQAEVERLREELAAIVRWSGAADEERLMGWVNDNSDQDQLPEDEERGFSVGLAMAMTNRHEDAAGG